MGLTVRAVGLLPAGEAVCTMGGESGGPPASLARRHTCVLLRSRAFAGKASLHKGCEPHREAPIVRRVANSVNSCLRHGRSRIPTRCAHSTAPPLSPAPSRNPSPECTICHDLAECPVASGCGHVFCSQCIASKVTEAGHGHAGMWWCRRE